MCPKSILLVLVGNKVDLESKRIVLYSEGEEFAKSNGLIFMETSALNGINIDNLFSIAAEKLINRIEAGEFEIKDDVRDNLII